MTVAEPWCFVLEPASQLASGLNDVRIILFGKRALLLEPLERLLLTIQAEDRAQRLRAKL